MHPRHFLRTVTATWRRHGAGAALRWGLEQMVNRWLFFEWLHVIELQRPRGDGSARALSSRGVALATAPVSTRLADEASLLALQRQGDWDMDDTKLELLRSGDTCVLSLVDGSIAGYTWVHTQGRPVIRPGLQLRLPDGVLYNFAGFTHPRFRGVGLQSRRHEAVLGQACWADRSTMLGYVKATNFDSRRGQARSGYRKVGSLVLLGTRRHFLAWLSPALRRRGLERIALGPGRGARRALGWVKRRASALGIALASHTLGPWWHRRLMQRADRSDHHSYTCFFRAPSQLAALTGPVLQHLGLQALPAERRSRPLRVLLFACSNGAEAYTWSAWLAAQRPDLQVQIEASDLHPALVDRARAGRYTWEELTQQHHVPAWFLTQVFDREGDEFVVNERTRSRVRFSCADLVHDDLRQRFGVADIVLAQNVLFHLPPALARRAFDNLVRTLAPTSALFIEGMDPALRVSFTQAHDLQPLAWRAREIYEESRQHIPARWWSVYYGAEPWSDLRREPLRRYGSIFLRRSQEAIVSVQAHAA